MDALPGLGADEPAVAHTYGVAELAGAVSDRLRRAFPAEIWVAGEIRSLRTKELDGGLAGSRHVYFSLVEPGVEGTPDAVLPVVLFDGNRRAVNRTLQRHGDGVTPVVKMGEGVQVRVRGALEVYGPRYQVQLKMAAIDPTYTLGLLETERERVLALLAADGLVGANAGRSLALVPWTIGLVTARDSAAEADFLHELAASGLHWRVVHAPTRVQGAGAEHDVAAAIAAVVAEGVDVVALVRGGGARTELAVFDTEVVARAVATAAVPVLTGIGHEIDTSVADLVAHTRHKTPTACAAALAARASRATQRATDAWAGIVGGARRGLQAAERRQAAHAGVLADRTARSTITAAGRLERAGARLGLVAGQRLRDADHAADVAARDVATRVDRVLAAASSRLDTGAATVRALDPARTLARGWSITRDTDGRIVRSVDGARAAGTLRTTFVDGTVDSRVEAVTPTPAPDPEPTPTEEHRHG